MLLLVRRARDGKAEQFLAILPRPSAGSVVLDLNHPPCELSPERGAPYFSEEAISLGTGCEESP